MELYKCTIDNSVFQEKEDYVNHLMTCHMQMVEVDDDIATLFNEFSNVLITGTVYDEDHTQLHFSVHDEETGEVFLTDTFYIYKDDSQESLTYFCNHILDIQEAVVILRLLNDEYKFLKETLSSAPEVNNFKITNVALGDISAGMLFNIIGDINNRVFEFEYFDAPDSRESFKAFLKATCDKTISGFVTSSKNPYKSEYVVNGVNLGDLLKLGDKVTVIIQE